ncbi:MAG: NTP transferase domain-containing protein [bacterium]|jgi:glucose-1-phosphate thymidylyltransferase
MKAIIPAAGVGTRLRPITNTTPKALVQVGDKPIIGHILERVIGLGIKDIVIVVGYLGDMIKDYVGANFKGASFEYVHQRELLGLGHAIWMCGELIPSDGGLFIIYGDTIVEGDMEAMFDAAGDGTLGVKTVPDPERFGIVELDGDKIKRAVEKPEKFMGDTALIGVNYFRSAGKLFDALNYVVENDIRTRGEIQITDAFQIMIERGADLRAFWVDEWFDCGKPQTLLSTNRHILERLAHSPAGENCVFIPPVFVAPDAKVSNSIVGPNVTIASGASVERCILSNTIVNPEAHLTGYMLQDSLIGYQAVVSQSARSLVLGDYTNIESVV